MASIRKRNSKWQVQIRREGFKSISKSFTRKSDAIEWANFKERQADRGDFQFDPKKLDFLIWEELLTRYSRLKETNLEITLRFNNGVLGNVTANIDRTYL